MLPLQPLVHSYIHVCEFQKNLSNKTTRAYQTDLNQFLDSLGNATLSKTEIKKYIDVLHLRFKPKTVKRKIASLKAFFNYLVEEEILDDNPFSRLKVSYKEPIMLPKTIPMNTLQQILSAMYAALSDPEMSKCKYRTLLLEICVLELLFATGMRVSELCNLGIDDINLESKTVRILGKGSRERIMQIENTSVLYILQTYNGS